MENLIVKVKSFVTSKKDSQNDYEASKHLRTAYIDAYSPEDERKLVNFGLKQYRSNIDNSTFFCLKCSKEISGYNGNSKRPDFKFSGVKDDYPNASFTNGKIALISDVKNGNKYIRLYAIQLNEDSNFEFAQSENPFL